MSYRTLPGWQAELSKESLQLRILRFGFFQDGDVEVGISPEREEIVVCGFRLGGIACHCVGMWNVRRQD